MPKKKNTKKKVKKRTTAIGKHPGGAPVKYQIDEILEVFRGYIDTRLSAGEAPRVSDFTSLYKWENKDNEIASKIPSFAYLYELAQDYKELSNMLAEVNKIRENMLLRNGNSGKYNSNLVKFELSAQLDWREKTEQVVDQKVTSILKELEDSKDDLHD